MDLQIQQAVDIALSGTADPGLKSQAYDFINHIKSTLEGYKLCIDILQRATQGAATNDGLKFFVFQVVDENIALLAANDLADLNTRLFAYLDTLVASNVCDAVYLRNKLAGLLASLFCRVYTSIRPGFLRDLLKLAESGSTVALDYYTRVVIAIHYEIGDKLIPRSKEEQDRNTVLKDAVRATDMEALVASWYRILSASSSDNEVLNNTLVIVGQYINWMEISLFVTNDFLGLVFQYLKVPEKKNQACLTLIEVISKKMKPANKLQLINLLNLTGVITSFKEDDVEFIENLAKLANQVGTELVIGLENEPALIADMNAELLKLWPLILEFLTHEYDDVSQQVFPFIQLYLLVCKKFNQLVLLDLLATLLNKVILKMKFDSEDDGLETDEQFDEIRARLKVFQDTIAILAPKLYLETVPVVIEKSLFSGLSTNTTNDWITTELGLYQLNNFADSLKNNLIGVPKSQIYTSEAYVLFKNYLLKLVSNSEALLINHPKIQLVFFELIVRHYNLKFFENTDSTVLKILEIFTSPYGLFNEQENVRLRLWYLFFRFVKLTRPSLNDEFLNGFLVKLAPLLVINAELPTKDEDDDLVENGNFNNQLYLFESVGFLISNNLNNALNLKLIDLIFQPLFNNLETCISRDDKGVNPLIPLQAHHSLMAIGTIVRGFEGAYLEEFVRKIDNASQVVLITLENFSKFENVRDASRFCFARFIPVLKNQSSGHLSKLVLIILATSNLKITELSDFLSFLGQIAHQFKTNDSIYQLLNDLLTPLLNKIYELLSIEQNQEYPDLIRDKYALKKAYMNFIGAIVTNNQSSLLITETNKQNFPRILQSFFEFAYDLTDTTATKLAIAQLINIINVIGCNNGKIKDPNDKYSESLAPVDGIDEYLMSSSVKLSFEMPFKAPEFDLKDAQFRNLAQDLSMVLNTYAALLKQQEFVNYLINYLGSVGMAQNLLNDFGQNLIKLDQREFKKYFVSFLGELKK